MMFIDIDCVMSYYLDNKTNKENNMKKRGVLILVLLVVVISSGSLFAANTFSLGLVNYYQFEDFGGGDTGAYVPSVRAEFFLSDYLGVSADALVLWSDPDAENYVMMYIIDAVLRFPLGLVEPYIATGPAYLGVIANGESEIAEDALAYNVRGGVDFNILEWLSVGAELNFLVPDVVEFFENIGDLDESYIRQNSLVGISAKVKF